jgi:folate-binding protein YgfZ
MPCGGECNGKFFGNTIMMTSKWQHFLEGAGAVIAGGGVQHFGDPVRETRAAANGVVIADLSHRALIAARGADAEKFLQGQLSNDILAVNDARSQLSAYCNPKGRTLALFRIFRRDGLLYLALPEALLEPTLARLRKYILMSKVTLEPDTALAQMGYAARDDSPLRPLIDPLPEATDAATRIGDITVLRVPGPHSRYEFIGPPAALAGLWTTLADQATPVGNGAWELLDILGGVPVLHPETVEAFVPQMLNLDLFNGINFKKGCYTGQEIVARTHYLGKLKRRMYRLHCPADEAFPPATPLYNTAQRADEAAGEVAAAQPAPEGGTALLAVLQIEAAAGGELRLRGMDGPGCTVQPLPYALETASG